MLTFCTKCNASEDIGLCDNNALLIATSALTAYEHMGKPEGLIPLAHAIIYACEAPKSNSVIIAKERAEKDAKEVKKVIVPNALKNHPSINDDGSGSYKYPHNYGGYVYQQYLPDELKDRIYYEPLNNGNEKGYTRKKIFDKKSKK